MRVMFYGTGDFAIPSLEALVAAQREIVACVTQPDRPKGRGRILAAPPVKQAALRLGLKVIQPERLRLDMTKDRYPEHDVGVAIDYGQLIPRVFLDQPRYGLWGVHPSLLPKYRGAAPVVWAIRNGETLTGVTIFRLSEGLDSGPILLQRSVTIQPGEDTASLTTRLSHLGAEALLQALELLEQGRVTLTLQDESQSSLAPKLTKSQGNVSWDQPAESIERFIRAMTPWPGVATKWRGEMLKIWEAVVEDPPCSNLDSPGTVLQASHAGLIVLTGRGVLRLQKVQLAGRRPMGVQEFLAGHPVSVGEVLG